jgi:hypothetical protein
MITAISGRLLWLRFLARVLLCSIDNTYRGNISFLTYENKPHIRNKKKETEETRSRK